VLWTAFASVFALLLGYSRIPYAAALDGTFFKAFARLHPQKRFPHVSLLVIGGVAIAACLISLDTLIDALVSTRVLVQFMAQTVLLVYLRRASPDLSRPFRMWLYPVPAVVALAGWVFVYLTSGRDVVLFGLGLLAVGTLLFAVWRRQMGRSREPL
jgi:amino acid transporter